jgi:hypothetical protein
MADYSIEPKIAQVWCLSIFVSKARQYQTVSLMIAAQEITQSSWYKWRQTLVFRALMCAQL